MSLLNKVHTIIKGKRLLGRQAGVLVAVSGGLDSMVLLHLLARLREETGWRLEVAHLNHGLRGGESDQDQVLVSRVCAALDLELHLGGSRPGGDPVDHAKISMEMWAREERHRFLAGVARQRRLHRIALGHHQDDQVELFLLRMLRGAGTAGLGGMHWISPSPANRRLRLIRPLLECGREELEAYAHENSIPYREDGSNRDLTIPRNRIRHALLPLLRRDYQPSVDDAILRSMELVRAEHETISTLGREWLRRPEQDRRFRDLDPALQREVMRAQLPALGAKPDFQLIENLRKTPDQPICIAPNRWICRARSGKVTRWHPPQLRHSPTCTKVQLSGAKGVIPLGGTRIEWSVVAAPRPRKGAYANAPGREVFDAGKVGTEIILRHWQPGDRFQPLGMSLACKLQDLFVNAKIPRDTRRGLWLAATPTGEVFWVERLRMAEGFKLDKQSTHGLNWVVRRP